MPGPPWPVDAGGGGPAFISPGRGATPWAVGVRRPVAASVRRGFGRRGTAAPRPTRRAAPARRAGADVATPIAGATPLVLRRRLGTGARLVRSRSSAAAPTQVLYDRTTPVGRHSRVLSGAAHDAVGRA